MAEVSLLQALFTEQSLIELAVRSVVSGIILFLASRLVGAKGGLLAAMGVGLLTSIVTVFLFEAYVFPLLDVQSGDLLTALSKNLFGYLLSFILPYLVWFFMVMILLRLGPMHAIMLAFILWLMTLGLGYFGVFTFLNGFIVPGG